MTKKILAIDDDKDILTILDIIFVDEGYELVLMQTGVNASEVTSIHPDLILLDVNISGFPKSGLEICLELKSKTELSSIPVILLSSEDELGKLALACHADDYISKPFDVDNLIGKVREYIN